MTPSIHTPSTSTLNLTPWRTPYSIIIPQLSILKQTPEASHPSNPKAGTPFRMELPVLRLTSILNPPTLNPTPWRRHTVRHPPRAASWSDETPTLARARARRHVAGRRERDCLCVCVCVCVRVRVCERERFGKESVCDREIDFSFRKREKERGKERERE